ncbi:MAG: zinc-binding dehydrogenase [Cyclobacteriaceae bacterium]
MKALVKTSRAPGELQLQNLPLPNPTGTYMLAKVAYAGICGSDLDILNNRTSIYKPPVVQGHEFSAIVEKIGSDVVDFKPGDYVVSETTLNLQGIESQTIPNEYHLSPHKQIIGWTKNGGFASHVLINSKFSHKLEPHTDLKVAAMAEPIAIAAESVFIKGTIKRGDSVAVIGPGPIGILCALIAKHYGEAEKVFLVGLPEDELRLVIAQKAGIDHCLQFKEGISNDIQKMNMGNKVDLVIDATGSIHGFNLCLDIIRRNGRLVEVGSITEDTMFSWEKAAYLSLNLYFVFSSTRDAWNLAIDFLQKNQKGLRPLITQVYALEEFEQAFSDANNVDKSIKVLFKPN